MSPTFLTLFLTLTFASILCVIPHVKYVPEMLSTLVHEVGHGVSVLPFGGSLPKIKIMLNTSGEAESSYARVPRLLTLPTQIVHIFSGYSAPIFVGIFFICSALGFTTEISGWFPIIGLILAASVVTFSLRIFPLIGWLSYLLNGLYWIALIAAVCGASAPFNASAMSGIETSLTVFFFIGFVALFATRSVTTLLVVVAWFIYGFVGFSLLQMDTAYPLIFIGGILLARGIVDIIEIAKEVYAGSDSGSDFAGAAEEIGGSARFWLNIFIAVTVALATLLAVYMCLHTTWPVVF